MHGRGEADGAVFAGAEDHFKAVVNAWTKALEVTLWLMNVYLVVVGYVLGLFLVVTEHVLVIPKYNW